jgi:hypothetical protein
VLSASVVVVGAVVVVVLAVVVVTACTSVVPGSDVSVVMAVSPPQAPKSITASNSTITLKIFTAPPAS